MSQESHSHRDFYNAFYIHDPRKRDVLPMILALPYLFQAQN